MRTAESHRDWSARQAPLNIKPGLARRYTPAELMTYVFGTSTQVALGYATRAFRPTRLHGGEVVLTPGEVLADVLVTRESLIEAINALKDPS